MKWKRITGVGYDLVGTRYGVRWSWGTDAEGELVDYKREYALIDVESDENLDWFDYAGDAKRAAERRAEADARRVLSSKRTPTEEK